MVNNNVYPYIKQSIDVSGATSFFINGFEVSEHTYVLYLEKEIKRTIANCRCFDISMYKPHSKLILNNILFEME